MIFKNIITKYEDNIKTVFKKGWNMNNKNVRYDKNNNLDLKDFYMTTILAINYNDGIVIASDDQVTMGGVKRSQ